MNIEEMLKMYDQLRKDDFIRGVYTGIRIFKEIKKR